MAIWLKQSTSVDLPIGPFVDATDGVTAETGLTLTQPDIRLKKNAGNWAQKAAAQTLSHEENGWYEVTLDATDTDTLGQLKLAVHESGALPVWADFTVVPANVWDSLFGADRLQVDAVEISGDSAAADNAESFFDGTGYAGTNNVIPTVTTATNVTTVNGLAANVITSTAIANDAITAAKIATGAIDADAIADNAIDAGAIAADAITAAKIADGAIDAATFAAGAITATVAPNLDAAVSSRSTVTTAQVNTEVVDVIRVDTISELAQAAPAATPTVATALMLLYMALRNEFTQTATLATISNDAGTVICKSTTADDATTFTRGEWVAGP
jgi:hypothetical protein